MKLIIENFGPLKNIEINMADIDIYIGPQATGKSTIAKNIFFFKSLRDDLVKFTLTEDVDNTNHNIKEKILQFKKNIRQKFLDYWGSSYPMKPFKIIYYYRKDRYIELFLKKNHLNKNIVDIELSEQLYFGLEFYFKVAEPLAIKYKERSKAYISSSEITAMHNDIRLLVNKIETEANSLFGDDRMPIFIPAGRSISSVLSDQFSSNDILYMDFLMRNFIDRINASKRYFNGRSFHDLLLLKKKEKETLLNENISIEDAELAEKIIISILKGRYTRDNEGDKIFYDDKNFVKLFLASSGQQEVIWILMLVFLFILNKQKVYLIVEEPEVHLFPEAQKELMDLFSLLVNDNENQILITTHSPYILSSINNLIYCSVIGQKNNKEVSQIVNKKLWINKKVNSWMVEKGSLIDIVDKDTNMIYSEKIDDTSRVINDIFTKLSQYDDNG